MILLVYKSIDNFDGIDTYSIVARYLSSVEFTSNDPLKYAHFETLMTHAE